MRRIVIWLASTVTVVVLLFGYHTWTNKTTSGTTEGGTSGSTTSAGNESSASPWSPTSGSGGSVRPRSPPTPGRSLRTSMARPAVATATADSSMDVMKAYGAKPSAVHAVRKVNLDVGFGEFVGSSDRRGRGRPRC